MHTTTPMVIDCQSCPVREIHCDDCMVTALGRVQPLDVPTLGTATQRGEAVLPLDAAERRAVDAFVRAGLVDAGTAATLRARRAPWGEVRAVG